MATVKPEELEALVALFEASNWDEMHLQIEGLDIFLSSDPKGCRAGGPAIPLEHAVTRPLAVENIPRGMGHIAPPPVPHAIASDVPDNWVAVAAPMLGTFYRGPKPGEAPYCEIGEHVEAQSEVCLVEVMKLFTTVRAGTEGMVRKICANDGDLVEFDQILFYIEPP
jgi:acetyl-CoA carboxylase biotin carboxyl carrier protein